MANTVLAKIIKAGPLRSLKPSFSNCSLTKSPYIFTDFIYVRCTQDPKECNIRTNWRHLSDKISEKGRGDEKNYFLKLSREQFVKIKEKKIKEIIADIRALEVEVREMDRKTSLRAEKVRQNLMVEIRELKAMLEKFKKSL
ncbi:uncharacterized protein LOC110181115 [Drosophila serrata]|uniref:uncharacterized protein LOC110181115 n=1 Tax=Drosophila serrata TaxID=7274 RepID=UPI000A1D343D|nr:uncharacterized protein LOC110181115 [Drosophila serrata]